MYPPQFIVYQDYNNNQCKKIIQDYKKCMKKCVCPNKNCTSYYNLLIKSGCKKYM